jgi:glycine cleavage system aminomethyltransferase T
MAYVTPEAAARGTALEIEVHGRPAPAEVVARPFITLKHRKG